MSAREIRWRSDEREAAAARGEAEAVFRTYADRLLAFATGLVGPHDAADVVSNALLRALWSPSWADVRNPRAYLYQCVLNEARRHHRDDMRRRAKELKAARRDDVVSLLPEVRPEVLEAVGKLSLRQRAVIFLTYWNGLTPQSVAEHLGISEGSVRRHLARARARLRRSLDA